MSCCECCCNAVGGECCGEPGSKTCCKDDRVCCNKVCCQPEHYCCKEVICCPNGQACCGTPEAAECCDEGATCCKGLICCDEGEVCCGTELDPVCCPPGQCCYDGVCEPCDCESDEDCGEDECCNGGVCGPCDEECEDSVPVPLRYNNSGEMFGGCGGQCCVGEFNCGSEAVEDFPTPGTVSTVFYCCPEGYHCEPEIVVDDNARDETVCCPDDEAP